ncbi:MAG: bifunctional riboflavin kinase/FAD synthetase [Rhodothermales bacterium]
MIIQYGPDIIRDDTTVLTVGTFDGVHVGHQAIIKYLNVRADQQGGTAAVLTFDPHPRTVLTGQPTPLLTTIGERAQVLEEHGVKRLIVLPFTRDLAAMEAEDYVREVLVQQIGLREIVVGYDHAFGRARLGNTELLRQMSESLGFAVDRIPAAYVDDAVVSSTRIRKALMEDGAVHEAANLLGRWYAMYGRVVHGDQRGRLIGFPTANLDVDAVKVVPHNGVYAVQVWVEDQRYGGMLNIGIRPTFEGHERRIEVHLFDFDDDLYGQTIRLEFVKRIRDERKFNGVDALIAQLTQDQACCLSVLASVS